MAKRQSRSTQRAQLLQQAAGVSVPASCDVAVVGGGAAGLVAAICAAEQGVSVVVLERDLECGRPILATGNGRCNFANLALDPRRFNAPEFVGTVCGKHWLDDVLAFFCASGLRWCVEDGRMYPVSRQAASVRNVLLARARRAGVVLAPAREVASISPRAEVAYRRQDDNGLLLTLAARAVILATGGGTPHLADGLGMRHTALAPVLCPLACEASPLLSLDGRRAQVRARLTKAGSQHPCWEERGEVLLRSYGLSGIVTFDLSRRACKGDLVELDLAPGLDTAELQRLVDPQGTGGFVQGCLDGVLDPVIARALEELAQRHWGIARPGRETDATDSQALVALVKALPLVVEGPTECDHAQVTRGGLELDQFDPASLASQRHPWLFACGETLDVDADCGGFNLGWAWKSGMVAGTAAGRQVCS